MIWERFQKETLLMKISTLQVLAAAWMSVLSGVVAAQNGLPFQWPHGAQAAVSLAYDDALDSQLDIAIPALDRAGLKGSFYLQLSNPAVGKRMAEWRAAARNDHELGNHRLFHQCSRRAPGHEWVQPQRDLDTTSVALSGQQLIAIVQQAAAKGTMVNFTFHGVGGDYLTTSAAAHEELLQYLAANRQRYWTDTFLNIMTYVKTQRGDH